MSLQVYNNNVAEDVFQGVLIVQLRQPLCNFISHQCFLSCL